MGVFTMDKKKENTMETIQPAEAKERGYKALTYGYNLPKEQKMFDRARAQLDRFNTHYILVKDRRVVAIWRLESEMACTTGSYKKNSGMKML